MGKSRLGMVSFNEDSTLGYTCNKEKRGEMGFNGGHSMCYATETQLTCYDVPSCYITATWDDLLKFNDIERDVLNNEEKSLMTR